MLHEQEAAGNLAMGRLTDAVSRNLTTLARNVPIVIGKQGFQMETKL
jgi:hypothetical protein